MALPRYHVFVFHNCMGQNILPCPKLSQKTKQRTHARSTCQWHLFWTLFYHITTKFMKSNVRITIHQIHKNGRRAEEVWVHATLRSLRVGWVIGNMESRHFRILNNMVVAWIAWLTAILCLLFLFARTIFLVLLWMEEICEQIFCQS